MPVKMEKYIVMALMVGSSNTMETGNQQDRMNVADHTINQPSIFHRLGQLGTLTPITRLPSQYGILDLLTTITVTWTNTIIQGNMAISVQIEILGIPVLIDHLLEEDLIEVAFPEAVGFPGEAVLEAEEGADLTL